MSIFYRIIIVLLILAAGYSLFGIGHFKWMYYKLDHPKAEFLISGDENATTTLVEFISYDCGYCKELHPVIQELLSIRKDIRYITRPVLFEGVPSTDLSKTVIAAGLQGKFKEIHDSFLEYPEKEIPDSFIKETAELYGIDYDKMMEDSQGKKVKKILADNMSAFDHANIPSVPSFTINGQIYVVNDEKIPTLKQLLEIISTTSQ